MSLSFLLSFFSLGLAPTLLTLLCPRFKDRLFFFLPLGLAIHFGAVSCFAALTHEVLDFGPLKFILVFILSAATTYGILHTIRTNAGKKKIFSPRFLGMLAALALLGIVDNALIFSRQGWVTDSTSQEKSYFRPPMNNDGHRHVFVINSLLRGTTPPFLPNTTYLYQLGWYHLGALLTHPFDSEDGPTNYHVVAGIILATNAIFFFLLLWLLALLRPALLLRPKAAFIIVSLVLFHSDLYSFVASIVKFGRPGLEADWSYEPVFLRFFSTKLVGLTAPQHSMFLLLVIPFLVLARARRRGGSVTVAEGLCFTLACLASPILSTFFFPLYFVWEAAFRNTSRQTVPKAIARAVAYGVLATIIYRLIFGYWVSDFFLRPIGDEVESVTLNHVWRSLPFLFIGPAGVIGLALTGFALSRPKAFARALRKPYGFIFLAGTVLFHYVVTGIEVRRHFALVGSFVAPCLFVLLLPPVKALLNSARWRVAGAVFFLLGAMLHGYFLYCYIGKPSYLNPGLAWADYFAMNATVKKEFPNLPIMAAINDKQGVNTAPLLEVTTSFSMSFSALVHCRLSAKQLGLIKLAEASGEILPYAEDLQYQAILWGPVEEITWGEKAKARFVSPGKLLARHGQVSLYLLSDEYQRNLEAGPRTASALVDHAELLRREGWTVEALGAYQNTIELDPLTGAAHHGMSLVLLEMGNPEPAVLYSQRAVLLDPSKVEWSAQLANARAKLETKTDLHGNGRE